MIRKIMPVLGSILIGSCTYGNESTIYDKSNAKTIYDYIIKESEPIAHGRKGFGSKFIKIKGIQYHIVASSDEGERRLDIEIIRGNILKSLVDKLADGLLDEVNIGYKVGTTRDHAGNTTQEFETSPVKNPRRFNKKYLRHLIQINRAMNR